MHDHSNYRMLFKAARTLQNDKANSQRMIRNKRQIFEYHSVNVFTQNN
jgi:hypothetical protein